MSTAAPELLADDRSFAQRIAEPLAALPEAERVDLIAQTLAELTDDDLHYLLSWDGQARPSQKVDPRHDALLVCLMGGRGSGKTRGGAEAVCDRIEADMLHRGALVSRTPGDVRRVMLEGVGGLMAALERRGIRAVHTPSRTEVKIIDGGVLNTFTAHQPEALRGPEFDTVWADEFAAWPRKVDELGGTAFSNIILALRLGDRPLGVFTTTPRATPAVREVMENRSGLWRVSRMATSANLSNLAPGFLHQLVRMFGGTRLFAQEVEGLYVEDVEGALWSTARLEASRVVPLDHGVDVAGMTEGDALQAKIALVERLTGGVPWRFVAVDPSFAEDGGGDECGITVGGIGLDHRLYVFGDYSGQLPPEAWAERVAWAYDLAGCTCAVVEANMDRYGVSKTLALAAPHMAIEWVNARTSKRARAEPVSTLWKDPPEPGTIPWPEPHQVGMASVVGYLPGLESELTGWDARSNVSPNRLDALAWLGWKAFEHLFMGEAEWSSTSGLVLPT